MTTDKRVTELFRYSPGFIAVRGKGKFAHYFGGDEWKIEGGPLDWPPATQIVTLDLGDQRLAIDWNGNSLPLVGFLNLLDTPLRQTFRIDNANRRVTVINVSNRVNNPIPSNCQLPRPFRRNNWFFAK